MLPQSIKPVGFNTPQREDWERYKARLALPDHEATLEFYRQVVYDHFNHFNEHYPTFELGDYDLGVESLTAQEAYDQVRCLLNKPMELWREQYDEFKARNHPYIIYQRMAKDLTPPFPPILVQSSLLVDDGWRVYGRDLHLIEGTHRVGYLRRMLERGEIEPDSLHKFVVLRPRDAPP
jgi:hypothetical protein